MGKGRRDAREQEALHSPVVGLPALELVDLQVEPLWPLQSRPPFLRYLGFGGLCQAFPEILSNGWNFHGLVFPNFGQLVFDEICLFLVLVDVQEGRKRCVWISSKLW